MATTPRKLVKKIKDAQSRIAKVEGKKVLVKKPSPVADRVSKAAQARQKKENLSLKDIMIETTARTRQLMREGGVEVTYMRKTKSGRAILCETVTHKKNGETSEYKQLVTNLDAYTSEFSKSTWIQIECNCPRYRFAHDWTLHQKEASNLKYSTNEPSYITNPQQLMGVCKHGYRVLQRIIQKGF